MKSKQAKSVCKPSSREINSFEKVRPGMRPRFLSQKIDAYDAKKSSSQWQNESEHRCDNTYERSREKDSLDGGKRNQTLSKGAASVRDPLQSPISLFGDTRNCKGNAQHKLDVGGDRNSKSRNKNSLVSMASKR